MNNRTGNGGVKLSLQLSLSVVFLTLTIGLGIVLGAIAYRDATRLVDESTDEVLARISKSSEDRMRALFKPAEAVVDMLGRTHALGETRLINRWPAVAQMISGLDQSADITSVYSGNGEGDFLLIRRVPTNAEALKRFNPPDGTRYIIQSLERDPDSKPAGSYIYLNADLKILRSEARADYVTYDPRVRPWYKAATLRGGRITTEPYVFFTTQEVGTTIARRGSNDFVIGADITLATLGDVMRDNKVTAGSNSVMVTYDGHVVAHPDPAKAIRFVEADGKRKLVQARVPDLGDPAIARGFEQFDSLVKDGRLNVTEQAEKWVVVGQSIAVSGTRDYKLLLAIPRAELLAGARKMIEDAALVFAIILAFAIVVVLIVTNKITGPLRRLRQKTEAVRRFEFDNDIHVHTTISDVEDLANAVEMMEDTIRRFLEINNAVSGENDFDKLVARLLDEIIATTHTEAGILYLTSPDDRFLVPESGRLAGGEDLIYAFPDILLSDTETIVVRSIADEYAVGTAATEEELKAIGLGSIGAEMEQPPRYLLAAPLFNRTKELVGVLLLIEAVEIDPALIKFTEALSGSAAISVETRRLIEAQKALFESFIKLIAGAIDAKSPYTGGHCERVPELTKMLAAAAQDATDGPFKDFDLDADGWEAIHVAAWLHDCGKVTTPEYVVDKSTKLETIYDRIHEIRMRVEVMKREAEIAYLRDALESGDSQEKRAELEKRLAELDDDFAFLAKCNVGGEFMADEDVARIKVLADKTWTRTLDDRAGISHDELLRKEKAPAADLPAVEPLIADRPEHVFERPDGERLDEGNPWGFKMDVPDLLYDRGEVHNLSVRKGTLTEEDRYKINEHIVQTIKMLEQLDFPKHLQHVPELAGGHHEKMDGTGYPKRLSKSDMSDVARMMAIADIFEALTAVDRPYKKGKTLSEALKIMGFMVNESHIDPELFDLFLTSRVYHDYAKKYLQADQIDDVDPEAFRPKIDRSAAAVG